MIERRKENSSFVIQQKKLSSSFAWLASNLMPQLPEEAVQLLWINKKLVAKLQGWDCINMTCRSNTQDNLGKG